MTADGKHLVGAEGEFLCMGPDGTSLVDAGGLLRLHVQLTHGLRHAAAAPSLASSGRVLTAVGRIQLP